VERILVITGSFSPPLTLHGPHSFTRSLAHSLTHSLARSLDWTTNDSTLAARDYTTGTTQGSVEFNVTLPEGQPVGADVYNAPIRPWLENFTKGGCDPSGSDCFFTASCVVTSEGTIRSIPSFLSHTEQNGTTGANSSSTDAHGLMPAITRKAEPYHPVPLASVVGLGPAAINVQIVGHTDTSVELHVSTNTTTPCA
jgi:hypothetical protein